MILLNVGFQIENISDVVKSFKANSSLLFKVKKTQNVINSYHFAANWLCQETVDDKLMGPLLLSKYCHVICLPGASGCHDNKCLFPPHSRVTTA